MVVVMIDNPREFRYSDLTYNPAFVDFIGEELLPWIHEHWTFAEGLMHLAN